MAAPNTAFFNVRLTAQGSCNLAGFGLPFLSVPLADL